MLYNNIAVSFPRTPHIDLAAGLTAITNTLYSMDLPFLVKHPIVEFLEEYFDDNRAQFNAFAEVLANIAQEDVK